MAVTAFGVALLLANAQLHGAGAAADPPRPEIVGGPRIAADPPQSSAPSTSTPPNSDVPPPTVETGPVVTIPPPLATEQASPASVAAQEPPAKDLVDHDILVTARRRSPIDPLEKVNVQSYKAIQALDNVLVGPIAKGYKKGIPKPARDGVHNFLDHVQEPIVFVNYLLQLKPGKAAETFGRFVINSTIGVAGLFDMAKRRPFKLPHRPNSLANTLGYYGVKPGPYFFLPLIGPTTLRDLVGISVDRLILPVTVGKPFNRSYYTLPVNVLSALDYRVAFDDKLTVLHTATDPYAATRDDYLRKRKAEIDRLHSPKWRALHMPAPPVGPIPIPAPPAMLPDPAAAPNTEAAPRPIVPPVAPAPPPIAAPAAEMPPAP